MFADYLNAVVPLGQYGSGLFAGAVIAALVLLNLTGKHIGFLTQTLLVGLLALGKSQFGLAAEANLEAWLQGYRGSPWAFFATVVLFIAAGLNLLGWLYTLRIARAITDTPTQLTAGGSMEATLSLPMGASGVQITVNDAQGRLVKNMIEGPQTPGTMSLQWNGKDAAENPVPTGLYQLSATAVVNGQTVKVPVSTLSTVRAISTSPADGSVSVEVDGGKTMLLTDVKRVGS